MNMPRLFRTGARRVLLAAACVIGATACAEAQRSFADLCRDEQLGEAARYTVRVLMAYVGTDECKEAERRLLARDTIDLENVAATDEFALDEYFGSPPDEKAMLAERPLTDLTPLASLPELRVLMADGNAVTDLTPLARLRDLEVLALAGSRPSSLAPLAGLERLRELDVGTDSIEDFRPVMGLTAMERLDLWGGGRLEDIRWVADMPNLVSLSLGGHRIRDLRPLAGLGRLEQLYLNQNRIRDVEPLARLTTLEHLRLMDNEMEDVTPLARLVNLRTLWLEDNRITDVTSLGRLPRLELLAVRGNPLEGGECPLPRRDLGGGRYFVCSY